MQLFYVHHRQRDGVPFFVYGDTATSALERHLKDYGLHDDGRYQVWPTVIPRSNNNECGSP